MRRLRDIIDDVEGTPFMIGAELVSTRGVLESKNCQKLVRVGEGLAEWGRVDWISITDNAGGNPMLAPSILGKRIQDKNTDVVTHFTCKDRNRNAQESVAWLYASEGLDNALCLTGDYPGPGYRGAGSPTFDLDSTTLIRMLADLNSGLHVPGRKKGSVVKLSSTDFFIGATVSPFKNNEAERMGQLLKMELKIENGASFLVAQVGYDMRKSHELLIYLRKRKYYVPVFGNVFMLNKGVADLFHKQEIPGCVVSKKLLEQCVKAADGGDKGVVFFRELAAKQYACFKGMGYRGAYFGGFGNVDAIKAVVELAESYAEDDWKLFAKDLIFPEEEEFYLYGRDDETGLSDVEGRESEEMAAARHRPERNEITLLYKLNCMIHAAVFDRNGVLYKPMKSYYRFLEEKMPFLYMISEWMEGVLKKAMFDCMDCGDCSLDDCYYLCPESKCRKGQRNGPCGGSRGPLCEVTDVRCIWYRAYHRAKNAGELEGFLKRELIFRDYDLLGTSSWGNYFLGRDHAAMRDKDEAGDAAG